MLRDISRAFSALMRNKRLLHFPWPMPWKRDAFLLPFSLWKSNFLKRTRRNQLFYKNHRTLSKSIFWRISMNLLTPLKWLDSFSYWKGLPSLSHSAHPTPASSPMRTVLRDKTILLRGYADKFLKRQPCLPEHPRTSNSSSPNHFD